MRAAHEAGADVAFVEGMQSKAEVEQAVRELAPMPVLLNSLAGGATPDFTVDQARQMGVKMVLFPGAAWSATVVALRRAYAILKKDGSDATVADRMSPRQFFEAMGESSSLDSSTQCV